MENESNRWRQLESDFRAIPDPLNHLRADRTHREGAPDEWRLAGGLVAEHVSRFRVLAAMAGEALRQDRAIQRVLPEEVVAEPDAMNRWFTAVRLMTSAYDGDRWYGHETDENGKRVGGIVTAGTISRIIEWSAVLCLMLAGAARRDEGPTPVTQSTSKTAGP